MHHVKKMITIAHVSSVRTYASLKVRSRGSRATTHTTSTVLMTPLTVEANELS